MKLPIIDFAYYDEAKPETIKAIALDMEHALTTLGFMSISNLDVSKQQLSNIFSMSETFFASDEITKSRSAYRSAAENFGYQGLGVEYLDPKKPSDVKETFTMRNLLHHDSADERWPNGNFRDEMSRFFADCLSSAYKVQRVFAEILNTDAQFFVKYHNGENVSLRLLHYPPTEISAIEDGQLGAGAHTDYGMITLLFQNGVGGLQVQDEGEWVDVDPVDGAIVVNTGDLMERWTNGRFKSTLHRVQPLIGNSSRYSIAMFVDPDTATPVEVLQSCITGDSPAKYEKITAGEHIQEKIRATHRS
ncbi:MAG: isopenicillin N synthase-like dioxygenase [Candidatus Azotimanducaceae bacterium]